MKISTSAGPRYARRGENYDDVAVVIDATQYQAVLDELAANDGSLSFDARAPRRKGFRPHRRLRRRHLWNWFAKELKTDAPDFRAFGGRLIQSLRYGENPHQSAAFYNTPDQRPGVATARQLQGPRALLQQYQRYRCGLSMCAEYDPARTAACVIVKHANPCGVAEGPDLVTAYRRALACNSTSAYGGIIAVNRTLDAEAARAIIGIFHRSDHRA